MVGGGLTAPELPDAGAPDAQTWVFAGGRVLEQPRADDASHEAAARARRAHPPFDEPAESGVRLYALPVVSGGHRLGAVVAAGVARRPTDRRRTTALVGSVVLGMLVLLIVAVAAHVLITGALRPVARMTEQADAWSVTDSGRRFGLGPPQDEFTRLAATLDALLDRVASSLRHEQRFSAEISHELRTHSPA